MCRSSVRGSALATTVVVLSLLGQVATAQGQATGKERLRARDLGIETGVLSPGTNNSITDVDGVAVGHTTLVVGEGIRTGVTAIVPHDGNLFQSKLPAAAWVANAFGKAAGLLQVQELGTLETPIVLTNTLNVGAAVEAVVAWTLEQPGNQDVSSVNAVVGETNDSWLSDIRGQHVKATHVRAAIESAHTGVVEEGSVGAGTGTVAFGWKGGIGTSSRKLPISLGGYTVGVLVQSNYGGVLTIDGIRVGERLGKYAFRRQLEAEAGKDLKQDSGDGSCMIIVATDAPLTALDLERLARRAPLGLARTGSFISNGSGDFVIAFSTAYRISHDSDGSATETRQLLRNDETSPLFLAVVEATEEAVYNSLLMATTVKGHQGHEIEALPIAALRALLAERDR